MPDFGLVRAAWLLGDAAPFVVAPLLTIGTGLLHDNSIALDNTIGAGVALDVGECAQKNREAGKETDFYQRHEILLASDGQVVWQIELDAT